VGTSARKDHIVKWAYKKSRMTGVLSESDAVFALDAVTGRSKWTYRAKHSIRHNAIAVGGGRVFLIDRPGAAADRLGFRTSRGAGAKQAGGELVALSLATGKQAWRCPERVYGTMLAVSTAHDVLLMSYQPTRYRLPSEGGRRMAAFRASTGRRVWDIEAGYASRPLINGRTIYAQPGAWDLLTGRRKRFALKRSYGCGILSGSTHMLLFRSATLGYLDLPGGKTVRSYGPARPGCWINAIPAGGIVLMPDATDRCRCSYLMKASIALQPMPRGRGSASRRAVLPRARR
jgi:outer membrane protein assembly factor BamB